MLETWFSLRIDILTFSHIDRRKVTHNLAFDGAAIHGQIAQVGKQFLGAILTLNEFEKIGSIVNELIVVEVLV